MTDEAIQLAWKGSTPLRIAREEQIYFIADKATGNGGFLRVTRVAASDADDATIVKALGDLAVDLLVGEGAYPAHLRRLGEASHKAPV
jgi:hypothetical protein